ncbi:MAG: glycosyltransferase family 39 protein [Acidobacteria bacterium]|nr:glycosyltransferase family 39 protein [Acidobacteriota bacterium]
MKGWWRSLAVAPEPLTRAQRWAVVALTLVTAITRWLALSRTLWDWDEALFSLALRHYDVAAHHPHPPGFPLYIATAKVFQLFLSDFHALQAVSFLAAVAIVPAMFLLGRELRAGFRVSLLGAALLAFFPNVWFYGGMALSDVPSMTLVVLAVALLLRSCRSDAALWGAAIAAAFAAGYRPQNLAIVLAPALIAAPHVLRRSVLRALAAVVCGFAIIVASYGIAVQSSGGWTRYHERLREHQSYITHTDSFRAPGRPPLWRLVDNFFIWPYHYAPINIPVAALVLVSGVVTLVRRRAPQLALLAAFGPFCALAILLLDRFSVSRFSVGYAPLIALFAADGAELLFRRWSSAVAAVLIAMMAFWTLPSLREVHEHASPPFRAMHSIPAKGTVYVDDAMTVFADLYLPKERVVKDAPLAVWRDGDTAWFVAEAPGAFHRERAALWDLARQRYFDARITPLPRVAFGDGWYDEEGGAWRWMRSRSVMTLPPGGGRLSIWLYAPLDALPTPPTITVRLDGRIVDQFQPGVAEFLRTYETNGARELVMETTGAIRTGDTRELGLKLNRLELSLSS